MHRAGRDSRARSRSPSPRKNNPARPSLAHPHERVGSGSIRNGDEARHAGPGASSFRVWSLVFALPAAVAAALLVAYFTIAHVESAAHTAAVEKELSVCLINAAVAKKEGRVLETTNSTSAVDTAVVLRENQRLKADVESLMEQVQELERVRKEQLSLKTSALLAEVEELREKVRQLDQQRKEYMSLTKKPSAKAQECNKSRLLTVADPYSLPSWKGYQCQANQKEMERYLNYSKGQVCPNDWFFVQKLIFKKNCFALPRRKCFNPTPAEPSEPLAFPNSLFNQSALKDENLRWDLHRCKSFECLNSRKEGDCRDCFNLTLEFGRWKSNNLGALMLEEVLAMKNGSLRLGLDVGGGSGSFAAQMALHGVTVMTTAFDVETIGGKKSGLPYMETIAQRGLIPLHLPHKARLPLFDGVLDIIHSMNSIKYLSLPEFEELLYEWTRVLRPGGLIWMEMFYAPLKTMPKYVKIIESLKYKKLYWKQTVKPYKSERQGTHMYLHCVLEKLPTPGHELLTKPRDEDMNFKVID